MLVLYILIVHNSPQTHIQTSRKVEPFLLVLCHMGSVRVSVCKLCVCGCPQRLDKDIRYPRTVVEGGCELIDMTAKNQTLVFEKAANTLKH